VCDEGAGADVSPGPSPRFRILGPLEVRADTARLPLGPLKQRIVLALLLCRANRVVSVDALCEALWSGVPPRTAHKNLQVYVSMLRKTLREAPGGEGGDGDGVLERRPPGYLIHVAPGQLDLLGFEERARRGRLAVRSGDMTHAGHLLGEAVAMWRGPALSDLVQVPALADEAEQLQERYLTVYEDWCQAELALGHHAQHVDDIDELARRHPYRERLRHSQMLALYQSGRQAEALAQFEAMRQGLVRTLGMQPSPVLGRLYEAMLRNDPALEPRPARRPPAAVLTSERSRLPRDVPDFTGRRAQAAQLTAALGDDGPLRGIALSGLAGAGTTALAVRCANAVRDRFPDGVALVRLRTGPGASRTPFDVLGELLPVLGATEPLPGSLDERAALHLALLAVRRTLVILDGARDEEQVRPLLPGAGHSRVLVTSRRRLVGLEGVRHVDLPPMPDDEALRLLGRLIGPHRVVEEPEAARSLVAMCGTLPLSVRIVGANLAALPHLTLGRYADRLRDERRLLDELVAGDLGVRPRFDSMYADLPPADRRTLHRLGRLDGAGFTHWEAARALGTGVGEAEKAVERLIAAHLVLVEYRPDGAQDLVYRLPAPLRVYARERAEAAEAADGDPDAGAAAFAAAERTRRVRQGV
jgi:DNA-binding SARP family transcriptional activator